TSDMSTCETTASMRMTSALFFLATARPATPTLFPYTTLFRSWGLAAGGGGAALPSSAGARARPRGGNGAAGEGDLGQATAARSRDRKSTRLNSSHVAISYAVFCLKKKIESWRLMYSNVRGGGS